MLFEPFDEKCYYRIEISQLVCSADHLTSFCIMGTYGGNSGDVVWLKG